MQRTFRAWAAGASLAVSLSLPATGAHAAFTINLNFSGLSAAEQSFFTSAKSFWESVITGYQFGPLTGFTISASGVAIDGVGGVLGSAGPSGGAFHGGFLYTTAGSMQFDTADISNMIANGTFSDVIKHEMAHVIGFGTLWTNNSVYSSNSGRYTGANALAEYKIEYNQPTATFVPVELGGGPGTADGHWDEVDGGSGLTGRVDSQGRDMQNELMSGWLNAPTYVSRTTAASFIDIGYNVNLAAVPEPGTWAMLLLGVPALGALARRRASRAAGPALA